MKSLQSTRSYHGTYPDALRDFYTRLSRIEKVTENIIQSSIRKDEQSLNDSMHHRDSHSPISSKCKEGYEMLEREAEKLLSIADQKYENYFMNSSVEHPDKKDCAFKDLYNLNHQIIKLLQRSEDKANAESLKADRNRRILQEIDSIFRSEGREALLAEIKTLNDNLMTENDQLLEE